LVFFIGLYRAVLIVIGIVIAIVISGGGSKITQGKVTYRIDGTTTKASVTYANGLSSIEQLASVTLPFEKEIEINYGNLLSIVSQNLNDAGSLTCKILVNG
jgi:hypothetical protein